MDNLDILKNSHFYEIRIAGNKRIVSHGKQKTNCAYWHSFGWNFYNWQSLTILGHQRHLSTSGHLLWFIITQVPFECVKTNRKLLRYRERKGGNLEICYDFSICPKIVRKNKLRYLLNVSIVSLLFTTTCVTHHFITLFYCCHYSPQIDLFIVAAAFQ